MKIILSQKLWGAAQWLCLFGVLVAGCGRSEAPEKVSRPVPDHIGRARAFYRQGDYAQAVEMYQKALIMDPDNAEACLQLGIIYDDNLKDEQQAIHYYQKFLAIQPQSEMAERVKGWIEQSEKSLRGEEEEKLPKERAVTPPPVRLKEIKVIPLPSAQKSPPPAAARVPEPARNYYTVKEGDSLGQIAQEFYGDRKAWKRVFEANRDILASPDLLQPGQVLKLPGKEVK